MFELSINLFDLSVVILHVSVNMFGSTEALSLKLQSIKVKFHIDVGMSYLHYGGLDMSYVTNRTSYATSWAPTSCQVCTHQT